jgi:hypothetical protein
MRAAKLASKNLTEIWRNVIQLWHHRCDLQHRPDEHTSRHQSQQLHPRVHAIYAQTDKLDHIDELIHDQPIHLTLRIPSKPLKDWILKTESFVKKYCNGQTAEKKPRHNFCLSSTTNRHASTTINYTNSQSPTINSSACENFRSP